MVPLTEELETKETAECCSKRLQDEESDRNESWGPRKKFPYRKSEEDRSHSMVLPVPSLEHQAI